MFICAVKLSILSWGSRGIDSITESALPVHRRSQHGRQTHPAASLVSASTWLHCDGLLSERWPAADYFQNPSLMTRSSHRTLAPGTRKVCKDENSKCREVFSVSMKEPTNLEAVLVGFQNGVDLRGCEDVAAQL